MITVYYKNTKRGRSKELSRIPMDSSDTFVGKCKNEILVGNKKLAYAYCHEQKDWIKVQDEDTVPILRCGAKGCTLNDWLMLWGGWLVNRVELICFKDKEEQKRNDTLNMLFKSENAEIGSTLSKDKKYNGTEYLMP